MTYGNLFYGWGDSVNKILSLMQHTHVLKKCVSVSVINLLRINKPH